MTLASDRPLVSVVIIFLNAERYISEAIDSVRGQTYPRWELLLVDDGSTDSSSAIAKRNAAADPDRVRYLEHPGHVNRGAAAARNLGIRNAAGNLVAFLDSDDVWMPEKLQEQVAIMLSHPEIAMVCGAAKYWTSWSAAGDERSDRVVPTGGSQDQVSHPPSLLLQLYPLGKGAAPCPSDLMLRRGPLLQVQGFEEHFVGPLQLYEDQAFLTKVYLAAPIYISSATWLLYRLHDDSCMARVKRDGQHHAVRQYFLSWLDRYLVDRRIADPAILDALRRARRPYESRLRQLAVLPGRAFHAAARRAQRVLAGERT
jgi:glycosyltransferase involved in cell wall biosynthesis